MSWDPSGQEHVQRMHGQQVACGWRADEVPQWTAFAKRGRNSSTGLHFRNLTLVQRVSSFIRFYQEIFRIGIS